MRLPITRVLSLMMMHACVTRGSSFTLTGQLSAETEISINGGSSVFFHTSCSFPVAIGDQFGPFIVTGFTTSTVRATHTCCGILMVGANLPCTCAPMMTWKMHMCSHHATPNTSNVLRAPLPGVLHNIYESEGHACSGSLLYP